MREREREREREQHCFVAVNDQISPGLKMDKMTILKMESKLLGQNEKSQT